MIDNESFLVLRADAQFLLFLSRQLIRAAPALKLQKKMRGRVFDFTKLQGGKRIRIYTYVSIPPAKGQNWVETILFLLPGGLEMQFFCSAVLCSR